MGIALIIFGLICVLNSGNGADPLNLPGGIIFIIIGTALIISKKSRVSSPTQSKAQQTTKVPEKQKADSASSEPPVYPPISTPPSSPKQKVCKFCGHLYTPGETFCTQCGAIESQEDSK